MMTMTITYDLARRGPAWKQNALKNLLTNLWSPAQQHQSCFRVPVLGARPHATNENCLKQGEPSCTGRPRSANPKCSATFVPRCARHIVSVTRRMLPASPAPCLDNNTHVIVPTMVDVVGLHRWRRTDQRWRSRSLLLLPAVQHVTVASVCCGCLPPIGPVCSPPLMCTMLFACSRGPMRLNAIIEVGVHFDEFINLFLFKKGLYRVDVRVLCGDSEDQAAVPYSHFSQPMSAMSTTGPWSTEVGIAHALVPPSSQRVWGVVSMPTLWLTARSAAPLTSLFQW